jgi:multidrug transporter EmrE-like cation transporter
MEDLAWTAAMSMKLLYISGLFLGSIAAQAGAVFLLPMSKGATALLPTLGLMICFCIFAILLSRLLTAGVSLSILVPLMAALGPLSGIVIGTLAYGEAASLGKIGVLLAACGLIVLANFV